MNINPRLLIVVLLAILVSACGGGGGGGSAKPNVAPVADAGQTQTVNTNVTVKLDGSGSFDDNADRLTYKWAISAVPAGSTVTALQDNTTAHPKFKPDVEGEYVFSLTVNDGKLDSANTSKVTIKAFDIPIANIAKPSDPWVVQTGSLVTLDGSGSTAVNGRQLTYQWQFVPGTAGIDATLTNATSAQAMFTPQQDGYYVFTLVVNDGFTDSAVSQVIVSATSGNIRPIANAGPSRVVKTGLPVVLDGSGSIDGNPNDTLTYTWSVGTVPQGSNVNSLSDINSVTPSFTPDVDGDYTFSLMVKDDSGSTDGTEFSAPSTVVITATSLPIAKIQVNTTRVETGTLVALDGSGSLDLEGLALTYTWSFSSLPTGSAANFSNPAAVNPSFTPDIDGVYDVTLVVNNGSDDSVPVTVTFVAATLQGSLPTPLEVAFPGGLPLVSWVDQGKDSYYHVSGLATGKDYDVSLTGLTERASLSVFTDAGFATLICESNSAREIESCAARTSTPSLYIKVWGTFVAVRADYTLDVKELIAAPNPLDEGTLATPVALDFQAGGLSYAGTVGTGDSYYRIANIVANTRYSVTLTGLTEDAELYVYDTAGLYVALCASTGVTTSEACEVTPTGDTLYIRVEGERVVTGTGFTMEVRQIP